LPFAYPHRFAGKLNAQVYVNRCPVLTESVTVQVKPTGSEPDKVRIRSIESSVSSRVNQLVVDTRNAGQGVPRVEMKGPAECEARLVDNTDGTYLLEYGAIDAGEYELRVTFDGKPVPNSPIKVKLVANQSELSDLARHVQVLPPTDLRAQTANKFTVDVSNVQATVTETKSIDASPKPTPKKSNEKSVGQLKPKQSIDAKLANQAIDAVGPLTVTSATDSKTALAKPTIQKQADGTYEVTVPTAEVGSKCCVQIEYGGVPVDGSAFVGPVQAPIDVKKVHVESMPVKVEASLPVQFTLDASTAGPGQAKVAIQVSSLKCANQSERPN
jgi:hypothetical protein